VHDEYRDVALLDLEPSTDTFLEDILEGLSQSPKNLPCKYFYDERGSALFDQICELDEYYPTRTELAIMRRFAPEMAEQIGPGVMLVEYGSGSSIKTRWLLDHLPDPVAYVPVDISRDHLEQTAGRLAGDYPYLDVLPVCADFTGPFDLPVSIRDPSHAAVYFPGSTIGNFTPGDALALLRQIAALCGTDGGLLIGIDLKKDILTIEAAYNDAAGVTAEFNLNLLRRINRELDGDFRLDRFRHRAVYNPVVGRVELGLVSQCAQRVTVADETFDFESGEEVRTEYSHKYTIDEFAEIAAAADLTLHRYWTDEASRFAVLHFAVVD
jgi:dimethylhistidine N-methyltransferase